MPQCGAVGTTPLIVGIEPSYKVGVQGRILDKESCLWRRGRSAEYIGTVFRWFGSASRRIYEDCFGSNVLKRVCRIAGGDGERVSLR